MTETMTGGCLCGAVRYEISAEPMYPGICHCRKCQVLSGAPAIAAFAVPEGAISIAGKVTRYESKADSGNITSNLFCPTCGSRVFGGSSGMPGLRAVFACSLDDPGQFKPGMHIYTESAQPWDRFHDELPKFSAMPQMS